MSRAFGSPCRGIHTEHSLGINVDRGWGVVLLVFGATMLALALRDRRRR
jgi:hypothetical protein